VESCRKAVTYTGGRVFPDLAEAASAAEYILITVSDDAIRGVCERIAEGNSLRGKVVVHTSGAGGLDLLESARRAGAHVASIHPIQSFADVQGAILNIPGSTFGVTADPEVREWAETFVRDLGGLPFFVAEEDRPLYHAAACVASNYLVALMHTAEDIYRSLGLARDDAVRAFWPLVKGTIRNIEARGTVQALTGPIARGDLGTVARHIAALKARLPVLLEPYRTIGLLTVEIALEKGTISRERAEEIKSLLRGETV
jgi:predicted short-subunit dehydrogenase-like oxidoreductase (DUF2520 family)